MTTLVVAYIVVWAGVATYVAWLGLGQRRLRQRLQELEAEMDQAGSEQQDRAERAA